MTITHDNTLTNKQKDMENAKPIFSIDNSSTNITCPTETKKLTLNYGKLNLIGIESKVEELKRLQLEIDEIEEWRKSLMPFVSPSVSDKEWKIKYKRIESNTARIREIILNEL